METVFAEYDLLERQVAALLEDERDLIANAANLAAFLYQELPEVNWAGFYFVEPDGLVLGPFCGKPACTRLPRGRGVCSAAVEQKATVVAEDVHALKDHIVCDSASKSEIVVPLLCEGRVFGVLDIDSPRKSRFTQADRAGLERIVAAFLRSTDLR